MSKSGKLCKYEIILKSRNWYQGNATKAMIRQMCIAGSRTAGHPSRTLITKSNTDIHSNADIQKAFATTRTNFLKSPLECRWFRARHHCKSGGIDVAVVRLCVLRGAGIGLLSTLICPRVLLFLPFALLHLDFSALFPVLGSLVMELLVLSCDLGFALFAVATTASTKYSLLTM